MEPRRVRPPSRREHQTFRFDHEGVRYIATASWLPDGRPAELFLDLEGRGVVGTALDVMAKDLATLTSLALQYGVPLGEILAALSQELDGTMRGPLGRALELIRKEQQP